ncbi:MAG TPA: PHP domain-containing protein [Candidatus Saccharimonadales bacterium]
MKIDLHTHSIASADGSLTEANYRKILQAGKLDCVAVTDHNTISFAQKLHEKLGDRIIVGEEITTLDGEIIGLYLTNVVKAGMSAADTVAAIKRQGGLVYVPHPFETVRKGVALETLDTISKDVDIIETNNGRAVFQNKSKAVKAWATAHGVAGAASSDAHGWHGWGRTYSIVEVAPTRATLVKLLASAKHTVGMPGLRGVLYPKLNRIRRRRHA